MDTETKAKNTHVCGASAEAHDVARMVFEMYQSKGINMSVGREAIAIMAGIVLGTSGKEEGERLGGIMEAHSLQASNPATTLLAALLAGLINPAKTKAD